MQQAYDAEGRLVSFIDPLSGANNRIYSYDGDGRRVLKQTNAAFACSHASNTCTVYVYDAFGRLAAEYSEAAASGGGLQYRTTDHLGSTRAVTNGAGAVTAYYDFTPFGERLTSGIGSRTSLWGDAGAFQQQFTGQYRDDESKLDYLDASTPRRQSC